MKTGREQRRRSAHELDSVVFHVTDEELKATGQGPIDKLAIQAAYSSCEPMTGSTTFYHSDICVSLCTHSQDIMKIEGVLQTMASKPPRYTGCLLSSLVLEVHISD